MCHAVNKKLVNYRSNFTAFYILKNLNNKYFVLYFKLRMNNFFEYIFYDIFKKVIYKIESKKVYRNIIGGNPSD